MGSSLKTYLLKGFDIEQTQKIIKSLQFVFAQKKLDCSAEIIERLNITLGTNDFLILFIDDIVLNQLINDATNKQFLMNKDFRNNQLLIVTEDLNISQLPEYLHYFPVFSLQSENNYTNDETDLTPTFINRSNLFDVINDLVLFIKQTKLPQNPEQLTIYIGPFDDNTTFEYQKVTRELLHRNFKLVPEVSNPTAKDLINNQDYLLEMLRNSDFAIHFIGHHSLAEYPEHISPVLKINQITANFCSSPEGNTLQRIIYVPAETPETPELVVQKIVQFKSDAQSLINAELLQTPIEKLKEIILQKVSELAAPLEPSNLELKPNSEVYFLYPPGAEELSKAYEDWMNKHQITFTISQANLDQLELLHYHQNQLTTAEGVLILHNGNQHWLERKLSDLIKAPGWGRKKPYRFITICGQKMETNHLTKLNHCPIYFINEPTEMEQLALHKFLATK